METRRVLRVEECAPDLTIESEHVEDWWRRARAEGRDSALGGNTLGPRGNQGCQSFFSA